MQFLFQLLTIIFGLLFSVDSVALPSMIGFNNNCSIHFFRGVPPSQRYNCTNPVAAPSAQLVTNGSVCIPVCHMGYFATLNNVVTQVPEFSAYYLTSDQVIAAQANNFARSSWYQNGALPSTGQYPVSSSIYSTGFDRGHMTPKEALDYSEAGVNASMDMSNIVPQKAQCNRGPWGSLESTVRYWLRNRNQSLYVVVGSGFVSANAPPSDVRFGMVVPDYMWMAVCDPVALTSVAFLSNNTAEDCGGHLTKYRTVASIEQLWGAKIFDGACRPCSVNATHWSFGTEFVLANSSQYVSGDLDPSYALPGRDSFCEDTPSVMPGIPAQLIIPAYLDDPYWDQMITKQYLNATGIIIFNPSSGPGSAVDLWSQNRMISAKNRGFTLIGYISTNYGNRAPSLVLSDIQKYDALYPGLDGFFLDETSDVFKPIYANYSAAIRARPNSPNIVVINPGTIMSEQYMSYADVSVVHEDAAATASRWWPAPWMSKYPSTRYAVMYHDVIGGASAMRQLVDSIVAKNVSFLFVTDDTITPNPWNTLPTFYPALIAQLTRRRSIPLFTRTALTAVSLLKFASPGKNIYSGSGNAYINLGSTNVTSEAKTVCATFVTQLMNITYGLSGNRFTTYLNNGNSGAYPASYYNAINSEYDGNFLKIQSVTDIQTGDIIANMYRPDDPSNDTGHVMVVTQAPVRKATPTGPNITGLDQWLVRITDSTSTYHGNEDTRNPSNGGVVGGIGSGLLRLYTDPMQDDLVVGYTWSNVGESTYYSNTNISSTRNITIGRLLFTPWEGIIRSCSVSRDCKNPSNVSGSSLSGCVCTQSTPAPAVPTTSSPKTPAPATPTPPTLAPATPTP
eukprot:PhF_6_TR34184/c0_g1_i2/m.50049